MQDKPIAEWTPMDTVKAARNGTDLKTLREVLDHHQNDSETFDEKSWQRLKSLVEADEQREAMIRYLEEEAKPVGINIPPKGVIKGALEDMRRMHKFMLDEDAKPPGQDFTAIAKWLSGLAK